MQHLESKTALMCKKSPNNKRMKIKSYIGKRVLSRQRKSEIEVKWSFQTHLLVHLHI